MRRAIVESARRAAHVDGAKHGADLADDVVDDLIARPGNIIDVLIDHGVAPAVALRAASSVTGIAVARSAWLKGPVPPWPRTYDVELCRQLGACPVAVVDGVWCLAWTDPEAAAVADSLGLPPHRAVLALGRDLDRFIAAADAFLGGADLDAAVDGDADPFAPVPTQILVVASGDTVDEDAFVPASSFEMPSTHASGEGDPDATNEDLDLFVDPVQRAPPTFSPPTFSPPTFSPPTFSPSSLPTFSPSPFSPSPLDSPLSSPALRLATLTTTRPARPPTRVARTAPSSSSSSRSSSFSPVSSPEGSRRRWLVGAALVVGLGGAAALVALRAPPPPPPIVVVTAGQLDLGPAQDELLQKARAEPDFAKALPWLSRAVALDPSSTRGRDAQLERARRGLASGRVDLARADVERLRRRRDVAAIDAALQALEAQLRPAAPAPSKGASSAAVDGRGIDGEAR